MKFCQHGFNFRRKFQAVLEYAFRESDKNTAVSPLCSLKAMSKGHWAWHEHRKSNFGCQQCSVSYFIHYDSLLQNATAALLQNATVSLKNAIVTMNCCDFIAKCGNYYKMRRLLQIATVQWLISLKNDNGNNIK